MNAVAKLDTSATHAQPKGVSEPKTAAPNTDSSPAAVMQSAPMALPGDDLDVATQEKLRRAALTFADHRVTPETVGALETSPYAIALCQLMDARFGAREDVSETSGIWWWKKTTIKKAKDEFAIPFFEGPSYTLAVSRDGIRLFTTGYKTLAKERRADDTVFHQIPRIAILRDALKSTVERIMSDQKMGTVFHIPFLEYGCCRPNLETEIEPTGDKK